MNESSNSYQIYNGQERMSALVKEVEKLRKDN